jgi:hypothetical protein
MASTLAPNIYRIQTQITDAGSKVDAGYFVDKRDRQTRKVRWEQLDEVLAYDASNLDRDVVAPDQIRTVLTAFRDHLFTDIFPGRTDVPKTLIFAKDDTHADDIVQICREVFGKGNDFCQKITYRTGFVRVVEKKKQADGTEVQEVTWKRASTLSPEEILAAFRNSYFPRIAVTVDMIATGTDIKPLEIVCFMRSVASKNFFEQMKGRGVRVVSDTEMEQVARLGQSPVPEPGRRPRGGQRHAGAERRRRQFQWCVECSGGRCAGSNGRCEPDVGRSGHGERQRAGSTQQRRAQRQCAQSELAGRLVTVARGVPWQVLSRTAVS